MTWHIEDGSTISIWQDPWLPIPNAAKLHAPPPPHIPNATNIRLADLILPTPKRLNAELLQMVFEDRDVKAILQIPKSIRKISYHIGWQFTKSGEYSVKSGYPLAL